MPQYNETVHITAQRLARKAHKGQPYKLSEFHEIWVPAAQEAVEIMAGMFEKGFKIGRFNYVQDLTEDEKEPFNGLMRANGLIPDNPGKEDRKK